MRLTCEREMNRRRVHCASHRVAPGGEIGCAHLPRARGSWSQASDFYNAARSRLSIVARTGEDISSPAQVGGHPPSTRHHRADLLGVMMTITPSELLDTSIAQLQILVAFLNDQLDVAGACLHVESDDSQVRACREVLGSLSALIAKVQIVGCAPRGVSGVSELRRNASSFTRYASPRKRVGR